ncbi:MAG: AmpG family muropeptide MFS transporter, partial [Proteobacteria bacterium]|nr:AmpG family muropeptide MFS transporter [Pseudomonadota bacterium]
MNTNSKITKTSTVVSWRESYSVFAKPRVIGMIFLGFAAGLPFLLVFSTLSAWLRDEGVARTTIGFFSWV